MSRSIELEKAQSQLGVLVREVMAGDEVTITQDQSPVAKLVPVSEKKKRRIGTAAGMVQIKEGFKDIPEGFEDLVP